MSQWKPRVLPIQSTSENIAEQTASTYERYKKIMEFKDTGFFLQNYVVEGGEATKNIENNTMIDVSAIVAALDQDLTYREGTTLAVSLPNVTYFLDYIDGDFHFNTNHPTGTAGTDYLTLATVSTNGSGLVDTITDTRSPLGGFRSNGDIHTASGTGIDELAGPGRTTETVKGNADDLATHKADGVHQKLEFNGGNDGKGLLLDHQNNIDKSYISPRDQNGALLSSRIRYNYALDRWEFDTPLYAEQNKEVWHAGNLPYEEGAWTPSIAIGGSSANVTHTNQDGRYTRIGDVVNFELRVTLSSKGSDTGNITIAGLPFTSSSSNPNRTSAIGNFTNVSMPPNGICLFWQINTNSSAMLIRSSRDNLAVTDLNDTNISDNTQFIIEGSYHI